jgi:hypothetical protein
MEDKSMKEIESKVFVGIRIAYAAFVVLFLIGIGNSRVTERMIPYLVLNILGIFLARWIAINYERGKNWARIWMFIANYATAIYLVKDISDFSQLTNYSRFAAWGNIGIFFDLVCIGASIYVIVQLHKKKAFFDKAAVSKDDDPERVLEKLKNMLDNRIITDEEYEKKRTEVLERM